MLTNVAGMVRLGQSASRAMRSPRPGGRNWNVLWNNFCIRMALTAAHGERDVVRIWHTVSQCNPWLLCVTLKLSAISSLYKCSRVALVASPALATWVFKMVAKVGNTCPGRKKTKRNEINETTMHIDYQKMREGGF